MGEVELLRHLEQPVEKDGAYCGTHRRWWLLARLGLAFQLLVAGEAVAAGSALIGGHEFVAALPGTLMPLLFGFAHSNFNNHISYNKLSRKPGLIESYTTNH